MAGGERELHAEDRRRRKGGIRDVGVRAAQAKVGEDGGVEPHDWPLDVATVSETRGVKRGTSSGLGMGDERVPGTPGLSRELFRPPYPTRKKPHASRPGFRTRFQNRGAHHVFRHRRPRRVSPAPPANPAPRAYTSALASRTPPAGRAVVCFFPPARGTRSLPRLSL